MQNKKLHLISLNLALKLNFISLKNYKFVMHLSRYLKS